MPDVKISALTALTGANTATDDEYVIVDKNIPETKKQTRAEMFQNIPASSFAAANVWNDAGADVDQRMEGDTDQNLFFLDASTDRVGFGTATPTAKVQVNGSFAGPLPITVTTDYTVAAGALAVISNRGASNTMTLPAASTSGGRLLFFLTIQAFTVLSASSNIIPRIGGAAVTQILPATDGAWALLQSDGTNWQIIASSG